MSELFNKPVNAFFTLTEDD